ncbi:hypothetical protein KKG24_04605 [Patescibacteria group bacterium]|nr:hypothetical protein [Patescibacteria group bacterium]
MSNETFAKLFIVHLRSGDTISAQFNPTEFRELFTVDYKNIEVSGLTFEPLEWDHTKSAKFSCELGFNAESAVGVTFGGSLSASTPSQAVALCRRFLIACNYPSEAGAASNDIAPSPLLIVWPGFMSVVVRQLSVEFGHREFSAFDGPSIFSAKLEWEAAPTRNVFYEDMLSHGTILNDSSGSMLI